jgi:hypothetical protein
VIKAEIGKFLAISPMVCFTAYHRSLQARTIDLKARLTSVGSFRSMSKVFRSLKDSARMQTPRSVIIGAEWRIPDIPGTDAGRITRVFGGVVVVV